MGGLSVRRAEAEQRVQRALTKGDLGGDWSLLRMSPDRLAVQQDLVAARSAPRILALCSEAEVASMDPVNLATAVYRLAKLERGSRSQLVAYERFDHLLGALSARLGDLDPHGMVNVLWALGQLELSPAWLPALIDLCRERHSAFSMRDLSATLSCLAQSHGLHASPEAQALQTAVVDSMRERAGELETPTDLVIAAAAFSRLGVRDEPFFARMAEQATELADAFDMPDVASILWAFANLNFSHGVMFGRFRQLLEQQVEQCSPRELVQISWTYSRVGLADSDLLMGVFAPVIRARMLEFDAPRDLCTLAWTFSNAGVVDDGFFKDLGHVLSAKVKFMSAHDISTVVVAFASIEYAHRGLFRAMQKHMKSIIHSFSALQLARTIYGLGAAGVDDETLFRILCERVLMQQHLLHPKNVVETLVGLAEAEYTPKRVIRALLSDSDQLLRRWKAEDAVQVLHVFSRLPTDVLEATRGPEMVDGLLGTVRRAVQGWWRYEARQMADLLEALQGLGVADALLLESVCRQLPRALRADRCSDSCFLRVLGALAELPEAGRGVVRAQLHRRLKLQMLLDERITSAAHGPAAAGTDLRTAALLAYACARLGFDGPSARDLASALGAALAPAAEGDGTAEVAAESWAALLAWALAEMGWEPALAARLAPAALAAGASRVDAGGEDAHDAAARLRLVWACTALGAPLRAATLQEARALFDALPPQARGEAARLAAAVALQGALAAPTRAEGEAWLRSFDRAAGARAAPARASWGGHLDEEERCLDAVSGALVRLRMPHERSHGVAQALRVHCAFPQARLALWLLGPGDLAVWSRQPLGSVLLRLRQLEALGWRCPTLAQHEARAAERAGTLDELLRDRLDELLRARLDDVSGLRCESAGVGPVSVAC
ncbi:unnamed protein product [Prorocentrum cordatum]|uniref:RNA-editing substrate-binding complex 6 protein domain-containing protein n=1 Tax=Prorocentrum cordatum TaxID=2364126 RepID=A0ABN9WT22_9DINO|nr:unnamed protein product [Polarella glacialis]